jgi:hypothetical protein
VTNVGNMGQCLNYNATDNLNNKLTKGRSMVLFMGLMKQLEGAIGS